MDKFSCAKTLLRECAAVREAAPQCVDSILVLLLPSAFLKIEQLPSRSDEIKAVVCHRICSYPAIISQGNNRDFVACGQNIFYFLMSATFDKCFKNHRLVVIPFQFLFSGMANIVSGFAARKLSAILTDQGTALLFSPPGARPPHSRRNTNIERMVLFDFIYIIA